MDVFRPKLPEPNAPQKDVRQPAAHKRHLPPATLRVLHSVAMMVGVALAFLVSSGGGPVAVWGKTTSIFSSRQNSAVSSTALSESDLDRQRPQKQAELLLESAVSHSGGAPNQIEAQIASRIDAW